jgi:osmotically inducible lipoprotein OsmB
VEKAGKFQTLPVCGLNIRLTGTRVHVHIIFLAQEVLMKSISKSAFIGLFIVAVVLTSGCANLSTHDRNTITGAGVGAVAGAVLTGGSSVGTVGGAAIGGYIGNQVRR